MVPSDEKSVLGTNPRLMEIFIDEDLVPGQAVIFFMRTVKPDFSKTKFGDLLLFGRQKLAVRNDGTLIFKLLVTSNKRGVPPTIGFKDWRTASDPMRPLTGLDGELVEGLVLETTYLHHRCHATVVEVAIASVTANVHGSRKRRLRNRTCRTKETVMAFLVWKCKLIGTIALRKKGSQVSPREH